mgnify:CR=1 FL=1
MKPDPTRRCAFCSRREGRVGQRVEVRRRRGGDVKNRNGGATGREKNLAGVTQIVPRGARIRRWRRAIGMDSHLDLHGHVVDASLVAHDV